MEPADRASPDLLKKTVRRGQLTIDERFARLRALARPILETSVAAAVAYALALALLPSERPVFASIAAVICLGVTAGQRGRRPFELVGGVVLGIGIADLIVQYIGTGPLEILVLIALAMCVAVVIGGGPGFITEAAISAILIASLDRSTDGPSAERVLEALTGGAVALVSTFLLFPSNPLLHVSRAAQAVFARLGESLEETAAALAEGDRDAAERALFHARETDPLIAAFDEALQEGRETARFAPPRRGAFGSLQTYGTRAVQVDRAASNARVLARAVVRFVRGGDDGSPELGEAVRDLARAVWALAAQVDDPTRRDDTQRFAQRAAARAAEVLAEHPTDLRMSHIVAQIQLTAADLMRAGGTPTADDSPDAPATEELLVTPQD